MTQSISLHAFGEIIGKPERLAQFVEDPEVGFRFALRLDRRRLEHDDAVIELLLAVMAVAAEARPFADVGALEIGAGRQDDVGEFRFALEPDRLVDDEFEIRRLVHPHPAVGVVHRREDRAAVFVEHVHRRMAGRRIGEFGELVLDRFADPRIALGLAVDDRLRDEDARDALTVGIHGRQLRHALVELDRHRRVFQIARHAAVGIAGEIEIEVDRRSPIADCPC